MKDPYVYIKYYIPYYIMIYHILLYHAICGLWGPYKLLAAEQRREAACGWYQAAGRGRESSSLRRPWRTFQNCVFIV